MNPFPPPRGAFFPNMPPMPMNIPNLLPGQFPPMPMGIPLPVGLPNSTQVVSMGITLPTGVTSISAPPVRKIVTPTVAANQSKPSVVPYHVPHHPISVNKQQSTFNNQKSKYTGPIITVFVGNINERVSDFVIRQILDKCGNVTNWKRIKGPNGKFQAFGFCDYAEADSALRAIRLLNEFEIGDKKLCVRVDAKQKEKLDTYAKENDKDESSKNEEEESDKKDENALEQIKEILKENENELKAKSTEENENEEINKSSLQQQIQPNQRQQIPAEPNLQNFSDMDIEDEKKTLIHREIGKFRNTYKKQDEEKEKQEAERAKEREFRKERERRDRDRERSRLTPSRDRKIDMLGGSSRYDRERERDRYDRNDRTDRSERMDRNDRNDRIDRNDRNERNDRIDRPDRMDRNEREMSSRSAYEDEDQIEQRRQMREDRKKEQSYQKRLKDWESREDRKQRQYEKEKYRQAEKKKDEEKDLLRLKQFLEDYNDELDDSKYYKGNNLVRKLRDFEKEREEDERDRIAEKKELEELRLKLAEEGHPDPESEAKKLMSKDKESSNDKLADESNDNGHWVSQQPNEEIHVKSFSLTKQDNRPLKSDPTLANHDTIDTHITPVSDFINQTTNSTVNNNNNTASTGDSKKKKQLSVHEIFNSNEEDDKTQVTKKRKLPVFIDDTDSNQSLTSNLNSNKNSSSNDSKSANLDDKRKQVKALIENIPTSKEELFKYEIEWDFVDTNLMEKRIRPWINKKITEYIGEEEKALLDFICGKLNARCDAKSILDDVAMVLDEEAEVFVVKMLRLLIYEIESKKIGLGK